jgi:hypothetical protein
VCITHCSWESQTIWIQRGQESGGQSNLLTDKSGSHLKKVWETLGYTINQSINICLLSVSQSVYLFVCLSVSQLINQSIYLSIYQSIDQSINQSINQYTAHLLSQGFMHFLFFSFNQQFLGSLNQSVLGARKVGCQIAIHSLTSTTRQSSTTVFHPEKQYTECYKWTP